MIVYVTKLVNGGVLAQFLRPTHRGYEVVRVRVADPGLAQHLRLTAALWTPPGHVRSTADYNKQGSVAVLLSTQIDLSDCVMVDPIGEPSHRHPVRVPADVAGILLRDSRTSGTTDYVLRHTGAPPELRPGLLFSTSRISDPAIRDANSLFSDDRRGNRGFWFNWLFLVGLAAEEADIRRRAVQSARR